MQEQQISNYDMSDFLKTKKRQKNKNHQVSFFVKYMMQLIFIISLKGTRLQALLTSFGRKLYSQIRQQLGTSRNQGPAETFNQHQDSQGQEDGRSKTNLAIKIKNSQGQNLIRKMDRQMERRRILLIKIRIQRTKKWQLVNRLIYQRKWIQIDDVSRSNSHRFF